MEYMIIRSDACDSNIHGILAVALYDLAERWFMI